MELPPCDVRRLAEMLHPIELETEEKNEKNVSLATNNHCLADLNNVTPQNGEEEIRNNANGIINEADDRLRPQVSFAYTQEVRPEDIFLGLGLRNPGTASCECLRVTLQMPEEEAGSSDIDAQVECSRNSLEVRSPRYRLTLPFPHPVDHNTNTHRAQWNAEKRELVVIVRIRRELDYINF